MNQIPKDFWDTVETDNLKYVIYGDSVAGSNSISVKIKRKLYNFTYDGLWNELIRIFNPNIKTIDNKDYIFFSIDDHSFKVLTYSDEEDKLKWTIPTYFMRHTFNGEIISIESKYKRSKLKITKNHSVIKINSKTNILEKEDPEKIKCLLSINHNGEFIGQRKKIFPSVVINRNMEEYSGYVYDFEIPDTHNFTANGILVHNTDSLYLSVPEIKCKTAKDYVEKGESLATEINTAIIDYMNDQILPKMNVPGHNETDFKTELIMDAILFTDVKKKYCFREIASEGTIHEKPIIKYTGISVVRTNTASWTKDFIREIIEDLAFNNEVQTKKKIREAINRVAEKYRSLLIADINVLDFSKIGVPCKWGNTKYKRDTGELIGMKLYNTITNQDFFKPNTSGMKIPIKIKNLNDFMKNIQDYKNNNKYCIGNTSLDKLNFLVVPIYHLEKELRPILEYFGIEIDVETTWNKLVETTLIRIIKCIKEKYELQ